ncbi:helix-turn-helix transcriptional regulator [Hymenobacter properus]|uniref:Helix-turn-helix transcriptional regulator n=1 Tax=Hymenobacter properus TaxID=2791026 RepID=A0A931BH01_9BACT|nr:helix-turn-helix transcriptional regulator [Hymenobacter properus]MBF9140043.1 helix-turn-helix transcriptional regulator [Hymenobacter properus]MBR7718850.1 helix-turn-helix transcriptional regulator [Microvirga sp. SRT04]
MVAIPASETIDRRFAQLIQQFGLTKNSFAISLGKTASVVQHLIDGRNKPGYDLLCKVFEVYPNVSRDWLLLGRGPMLVGGEPIAKPAPRSALPAPESPLEPIDLSDIEVRSTRRAGSGATSTQLQPEEITATLVLAAAAQQPARTAAPVLNEPAPQPIAPPAAAETPSVETKASSLPPVAHPEEPVIAAPPVAAAASAQPMPAAVPAAAPYAAPNPEAYISAALHAQHMQHQLAMAELRNQHLLEQQQMLREMLAMARQAMV